MFDAITFLRDYRIPGTDKGKNCSRGWININCPFHSPSDTSNHLGFNLSKGYASCWKCGSLYLIKLISALLHVSYSEAKEVISKYQFKGSKSVSQAIYSQGDYQVLRSRRRLLLPSSTGLFEGMHIRYLEKRDFDPEKLQEEFGLVGTGPFGDYKFRIIAPIIRNNKLISYQGRDVTDKSPYRYMACNKKEEIIHFKHCLYNVDNVRDDKVIICEGPADVWRIGDGSIATFGTGYTKEQIIEIVSRFNVAFILYDNEDKAQSKADRLGWSLSGLGLKVEIIDDAFNTDPADMKELDAKYLRRELLGY